ncbi:MAG: class I SAM-dependent methyltransferase [Bacteroidales bacterium]|jgi:SAM-dependent methyltransferase|nr:class I SAM-dependent methyltransferase [Bacteroidales bacterium]
MRDTDAARVYGNVVDIDSNAVQSFWDSKAEKDASLKAVLLGTDLAENSGVLRNERENRILHDFIGERDVTVLDIGCGIGRWAHNLQSQIQVYHGIDFSEKFIQAAKKSFKNMPQCAFFQMSATEIDASVLLPRYDLVIVTGVAMYINDDVINRLFHSINRLTDASSSIYFQESVSMLTTRLTLKDFDSVELKSKYNAIYRTSSEYEVYFAQYLPEYSFSSDRIGLLLDKDTGAREETNAKYWFLNQEK